jgi:hypothetical protein
MNVVRRFLTGLFKSAAGRVHEERLNEEIAEHITLQTEENLRAGLSPVEARRHAMLKFGGIEAMKLDYCTARGLPFIENLLGDLRNAVRTISRMPALATVIIASLAIGIGVNTTIFSLIQMILFQPMPAVNGAANFTMVEPRLETGGYPRRLPGWNIATCRPDCRLSATWSHLRWSPSMWACRAISSARMANSSPAISFLLSD